MNSNKITVTEVFSDTKSTYISSPILDGYNFNKFKEQLKNEKKSDDTINHIAANAYQTMPNLKNPFSTQNEDFNNPSKVLCLGKVQSGKTSFFLASAALAFDNGYNVVFILGGTKLRLKKQNLGRVTESFKNNEKVKIFDVTKQFDEDINNYINKGFKLILVVLKNAAKKANLGQLLEYSIKFKDIPSVIIDDEGDEFTPGNPKGGKKATNKTHDKIVDIIKNFRICSFLSVTATPQANLLISTMDDISPDRLVLVQPGKGYTGGNEFFDSKDNPHVNIINDTDDFEKSIPDTFKDALHFFIFACALKRNNKDLDPYSMLVHPSSFNLVQAVVATRINSYYNILRKANLDHNSIIWSEFIKEINLIYNDYKKTNKTITTIDEVVNELPNVLDNIDISIINSLTSTSEDDEESQKLYQIKVGGNLLGRGLTINRLIVSYIYRDSKEPAVDTMYQRCRWFGYKQSYFDVCRVYMTAQLRNRFMAIVEHENHMWLTMDSFLNTQTDLRKFKRFFALNDEDLILTRKSVSNTVTAKIISHGNKADECIDITEEDKKYNKHLFDLFLENHKNQFLPIDFDNSDDHRQQHLVGKIKFETLFNEFLSKLIFATESPFDINVFSKYLSETKEKIRPEEITVMIMRHAFYEKRTSYDAGVTIDRLFQGKNDGTDFKGDNHPEDMNGVKYEKIPFIQIHLIKLNGLEDKSKAFPLLSFNNPCTSSIIQMVTGDNIYE